MKKFLSILFGFLILLSGMHLTVATHYCGGEIVASKVSLTGELASCGMEASNNQYPLHKKYFNSHCCDNIVTVFAVENNYAPSFALFKPIFQPVLLVFSIPASIQIQSLSVLKLFSTDVSPPDNFMVSAVSLPDICVFRI
jgi:hypothetical protein